MAVTRRLLFGVSTGIYGFLSGKGLRAQSKNLYSKRNQIAEVSEVFAYGVASGDPLSDRVILWTHVADKDETNVPVYWQVALDLGFESIVSEGHRLATRDSDYTIKIDAKLPFPATSYFYRFRAHDVWSTIGRTRTAPEASDHLRLAVVSCSSIWSGYFNAYERLSKRSDLDLIVHCGDYAYDVPDPDEQRNMPYRLRNTHSPESLEDHRQRYRYYRSNSFLRAAHQQHPFAIVWDNHDILTNAPVKDAIQAFYEWQPVRQDFDRLYRTLDYGDLLKITLLDTRYEGRGELIPGTQDRSILGEGQFSWLKDELRSSSAQWNLLVNQVLFSPFSALGQVLNKDSWQGFPKDVERVTQFLAEEAIQNTVIATGDAHLSFACNVKHHKVPVGVEFLPTSVSRGNLDENVAVFIAKLVKGLVEATVKFFNPQIRYFESEKHGYGIVDFKPEQATCEFWYVDHSERSQTEICGRALTVKSGSMRFTEEKAEISASKLGAFPLAPKEIRLFEKGLEVGGKGGDYFDGEERLTRESRLSAVMLRSDKDGNAKAIRFSYADGKSWQMGQGDGDAQDGHYALAQDEYIRRLSVGIREKGGKTLVNFISLVTSTGRQFESGRRSKQIIDFVAPEGRHVVGFHGRSGASIVKLGPVFAPDF